MHTSEQFRKEVRSKKLKSTSRTGVAHLEGHVDPPEEEEDPTTMLDGDAAIFAEAELSGLAKPGKIQ